MKGVHKHYLTGAGEPLRALDDLELVVSAGQSLAITGTSGSGKSTLLHVIGAMDRADAGTISVGGADLLSLRRKGLSDYRRTIGFVFQRFHLLPALTVMDNVLAPLLPYRPPFDKAAKAFEVLDYVGLADRANDMPHRLSGGQQQRVAIARALVGNPGLVLADEPTGNLDTTTGGLVLDLLDELRGRRKFTLLIATHDVNVAARCERSIQLQDGALVADSRAKDSRPRGIAAS